MVNTDLRLADCMDILPGMRPGSVDAIITDIPYNRVNRETGGLRQINKGTADSEPVDLDRIVKQFSRLATYTIYVWCAWEQFSRLMDGFSSAGMTTRCCVWKKTNPGVLNGQYYWLSAVELCVFARWPGAPFYRHCEVPVWEGPSERVEGIPTPKPVWLMEELVTASMPLGSTVLDPYMGGGSTGIACVRHGVNFIGIDKYLEPFTIGEARVRKEINRPDQASLF